MAALLGAGRPDPTVQSVMTVTIEPDDAGAPALTIEHTRLPAGLADQHARGWTLVAGQLARAIS